MTTVTEPTLPAKDTPTVTRTDDTRAPVISRTAAAVIAVVALVAFAVLLGYLLSTADAEETVWNRRLALFQGVEAIVTAVIGGIFGATPVLLRARRAEEESNENKKDAKEAQREATASAGEAQKGRLLAEQVKLKARLRGDGDRPGVAAAPGDADLQELAAVAAALYPD